MTIDPDDPASKTPLQNPKVALIPFLIAIPLLIGVAIFPIPKQDRPYLVISFVVLWVITIASCVVCLMVTVKWLANGRPPELSFYRIFVSRDELHWKLRHRPKLNDEEFYEAFYAGSGIPRELPAQLRSRLQLMFGLELASLRPQDNLGEADRWLDWTDVFYVIDREFKVSIPREAWDEFDGTFNCLLRMIAARRPSSPIVEHPNS
jgi:hypothetical protein